MQGLEDWSLVDIPHAGPESVRVVGMEVDDQIGVVAYDLLDGLSLATHGFNIQVQSDIGACDPIDHPASLGCVIEEIPFLRPKRLDGQSDPSSAEVCGKPADEIDGVGHGLLVRHRGDKVPLHRRAEHHQIPSEIRTKLDQAFEVIGRLASYRSIVGRQVETFSFGQEPMQSDDFEPQIFDHRPILSAGRRGYFSAIES